MDDDSPLESGEAHALPYVAPGGALNPQQILMVGDEPEEAAAVLRKALDRLYAACCAIDSPTQGEDFDLASDEYEAAMADAKAALTNF